MNAEIDLNDLEQMDPTEVALIRELIADLFGPFDERVQIEGVYFWEERSPHMVYLSDQFTLAICLPVHQRDEEMARLVHLSHELVHCLRPNGLPSLRATVLEEGLAEHAKVYLSRQFFEQKVVEGYDFRLLSSADDYRRAFDLVERLVELEGLEGMRHGVREVRKETGLPFAELTASHLAVHFQRAPQALLDALSAPFHAS